MNKSIELLQKLKTKHDLPSEDIDLIIKSIKNDLIKKKPNKKINKITVVARQIKLNKDDISSLFKSKSIEEINREYKLHELKEIYFIVYGFKPLSKKSKLDLIKDIQQHYHSEKRLLSFNRI